MTMNPQGAHYTLMGIETLGLRMERHVANARAVAQWLEKDPRVEQVTYAGLESSRYYERSSAITPKGAGALFTVALKGGFDACVKLVDSLKLFSHVANLGDTRSLVIQSASTRTGSSIQSNRFARGPLRTSSGSPSASRTSRTSLLIGIRDWLPRRRD